MLVFHEQPGHRCPNGHERAKEKVEKSSRPARPSLQVAARCIGFATLSVPDAVVIALAIAARCLSNNWPQPSLARRINSSNSPYAKRALFACGLDFDHAPVAGEHEIGIPLRRWNLPR